MYVKDLFCSTRIVLTQLCEEGHASCTLKTSVVVPTLFLPNSSYLSSGTQKSLFDLSSFLKFIILLNLFSF
jgi:hypothetical protein